MLGLIALLLDHRDLVIDVLFQQLVGREQVEVEVLLPDGKSLRIGKAAQQGGLGAHADDRLGERVCAAVILSEGTSGCAAPEGKETKVPGGATLPPPAAAR